MAKTKKEDNFIVSKPEKEISKEILDSPSYTITEGNFLFHQFASLGSFSQEKDRLISEVITKESDELGGKKVRKWKVTGDVELGFPGWLDEKVFVAVIEVAKQTSYPVDNPIDINIRELCRVMDISPDSGKNRTQVRESLQRIARARIIADNYFYYKKKEAHISDTFTYFQRVQLADAKVEGEKASQTKVWLSEKVLSNINNGYIRLLDTNFFMRLSPMAGRLYEILSTKMFGLLKAMQNEGGYRKDWYISEQYEDLCYRMPVKQHKYRSYANRQFNNAHQQLLDTGFLSQVQWQDDNTIRYYPGEKAIYDFKNALKEVQKQIELPFNAKGKPRQLKGDCETETAEEHIFQQELKSRGVSSDQVGKIVQEYSGQTIQWEGEPYPIIDFYCQYYDWQIEHGEPAKKPKSGAWLYTAIQEEWLPPVEFQTKQQQEAEQQHRQEREQKKQKHRRQKEQVKQKRDYFDWLQKTPAERWQERHWMYRHEFRQEHGRKPTAQEEAHAKEEYVAEPESPEEYQHRMFGEVKYPLALPEEDK